jgi:lipopolysaccharide transport system permease protein
MAKYSVVSSHSYRDLLIAWTLRIIRARYQQSLLGGLWAIIQPVATVVVFTIIFTYFIPVDTGDIPYAVFSYTAMAPWILFSTSLTDMTESLVTNMNLVSKIYFPREILVIAALLARLLDFFIAYLVLLILILYYKLPLSYMELLYIPIILVVQLCLSLGLGLFGAALNVFYRDIKHVVVLLLQIWFYATPIIYPITLVPEKWRYIYYLNPMAGIIEAYRSVILYNLPPAPTLYVSAIISVVCLGAGYWFFKRVEYLFADVV